MFGYGERWHFKGVQGVYLIYDSATRRKIIYFAKGEIKPSKDTDPKSEREKLSSEHT